MDRIHKLMSKEKTVLTDQKQDMCIAQIERNLLHTSGQYHP